MLDFSSLVFFFFAIMMLIAALGVIISSNPVYSALFLVLTFVASSALWLLLHAEFLAIALVLVYVGAVMVLFLFVIMMLDIDIDRLREGFWRYFPLAIGVGAILVWMMVSVFDDVSFSFISYSGEAGEESNTRALGGLLYVEYIYPFELAAILLLTAIVAAVALTLRRRSNSKYTDPSEQVLVQASDRVRLVAMEGEKTSWWASSKKEEISSSTQVDLKKKE